jgi:hypothetical protein
MERLRQKRPVLSNIITGAVGPAGGFGSLKRRWAVSAGCRNIDGVFVAALRALHVE